MTRKNAKRPLFDISMLPLWGILYGIAWLAWLLGIIGGMGNSKILSFFSTQKPYTPSEQYINGLRLTKMSQNADPLIEDD